ncbi:MAG: tRNA 5-methoxyuridine(34)/uridine 5-oxyacetic acid(34) synthase CmoB [Bdellovibrionota bacterium]
MDIIKADIIKEYKDLIDLEALKTYRTDFEKKLISSTSLKEFNSFDKKNIKDKLKIDTTSDIITVKSESKLEKETFTQIKEQIKLLAPWRIGPYDLLDYNIESEWNSYYKFNRLKEFIPNLKNKIIADIGGNNGYFSFRLSSFNPKLIVLSEPVPKSYLQYKFLQKFLRIDNIIHEPVKAENFSVFKNFFDVIFCLGVIYHQRNPLLMLNECATALKKNGIIILETICYDKKEPIALCPKTYSKMRNVWFLPTPSCLKRWLEISNFTVLKESTLCKTSFKEQRKTKDATFESLEDFLDKDNPNLTIEGYHSPKRYIVVAKKKTN